MRDNIEIDGIGKVLLAKPNSLVAISDVVAEWGGQKSRAKLSRIIAAAIGLSWSRDNTIKAPLYDVKEVNGSGALIVPNIAHAAVKNISGKTLTAGDFAPMYYCAADGGFFVRCSRAGGLD